MTTRPRLYRSRSQVVGVLALALFGVLAAVFLTSSFGEAAGFADGSVTETIGFALLNLEGPLPTEGFLVPLIIIAIVLDAALDAAVMLGKREEEEDVAAQGARGARADGGTRERPAESSGTSTETATDEPGGAAGHGDHAGSDRGGER